MKKFRRAAVYPSVLYGQDFIVESIQSILPHVEHVFVVMMAAPWGRTAGVAYRGEWVPWPKQFDATRERICALGDSRIEMIEAQKDTPWNRWGFGVNDAVRGGLGVDFDEVVILDPDCVFREDEARAAFAEWGSRLDWQWAHCEQVELWRTPAWQIQRPRSMISFHRGDLSLLDSPDPPGSRPQSPKPTSHLLPGKIHNLGFCVSEANMRWKFLTSVAFSPVVGESLPNQYWYEKTWLNWHPATNNRNLEISQGCESAVPCAVSYDVTRLPASILKRYLASEWRAEW